MKLVMKIQLPVTSMHLYCFKTTLIKYLPHNIIVKCRHEMYVLLIQWWWIFIRPESTLSKAKYVESVKKSYTKVIKNHSFGMHFVRFPLILWGQQGQNLSACPKWINLRYVLGVNRWQGNDNSLTVLSHRRTATLHRPWFNNNSVEFNK